MSRAIVYYSDVRGDPLILETCRRQLQRAAHGIPIVSVTLKPIDFGDVRIVLPWERSRLSMFCQIAEGLNAVDADYVFAAEHDVLYSPTHFHFTPPRDDCFFYNVNWFRLDAKTGRAVTYLANQVSQLCASRRLLLEHYQTLIERVKQEGYRHEWGYEPGNHPPPRGVSRVGYERWRSAEPNIDIRHGCNLTASRWDPSQFHDKSTCTQWQEVEAVPGWGQTKGRVREFLTEIGAAA